MVARAHGKIVCIGWNYRSHIKELESALPEVPTVFLKPSSCLIGDGDAIVIPEGVTNVQHEVELAVVIGKDSKNVPEDDALSYVSHLAVFDDVSARDMQKESRLRGDSWDLSKGIDTFGPMSEPIPYDGRDLQDLELVLTVNGEVRQRGSTRDMIFPVAFLISYASRFMTLEEGDILITGTPEGVSEIRPGDVVRAEIAGVGAVENPVRQE
jgi:2-keto-4-pentenoate hydratase/2-oxohepta-3-ene-1,7-dioic acid hydratase in catechol pathway